MTRFYRFVGPTAEQQAEDYARAVDDVRGWPRCNHPRWTLSAADLVLALRGRGRLATCLCTEQTGSGLNPACPHVTMTEFAPVRSGAGEVYALETDASTVAALPPAVRATLGIAVDRSRADAFDDEPTYDPRMRLRDRRSRGRPG